MLNIVPFVSELVTCISYPYWSQRRLTNESQRPNQFLSVLAVSDCQKGFQICLSSWSEINAHVFLILHTLSFMRISISQP